MPKGERVPVVLQPVREVDGAPSDELSDQAAQGSVDIALTCDGKP